jgi:predicted O-methyltransferase YrrM
VEKGGLDRVEFFINKYKKNYIKNMEKYFYPIDPNDKRDIYDYWAIPAQMGEELIYEGHKLISQGNLPQEALDYLEKLEEPGICVEIGVLGGATFLEIFRIIRNKNIQLYGIDPWELAQKSNGISKDLFTPDSIDRYYKKQKDNRKNLQKIVAHTDTNNQCDLIHGFSDDLGIVNRFRDNTVSFLHIDGDHSYENVTKDLRYWFPKLKSGGLIVGDDYSWPSVAEAFAHFIDSPPSYIEWRTTDSKYFIHKG